MRCFYRSQKAWLWFAFTQSVNLLDVELWRKSYLFLPNHVAYIGLDNVKAFVFESFIDQNILETPQMETKTWIFLSIFLKHAAAIFSETFALKSTNWKFNWFSTPLFSNEIQKFSERCLQFLIKPLCCNTVKYASFHQRTCMNQINKSAFRNPN